MSSFIEEIIILMNEHFICEIDWTKSDTNKNIFIMRTNIVDKNTANEWLKLFSLFSNTNWIVNYELASPQRVIFHKFWLCQHASKNKTNKNGVISKRNTICQALLNILFKKNNKDTRKNDSFLKKDPPLCALVQLKLNHNHPINSCGALRHLRVSDETRKTFLAYFDDGLTESEALHTHESKLMLLDNACSKLANAALNPTKRQVYYIHYEWRKDNYGPIHEPLPKLKEKTEFYNKQGVIIEIKSEMPWAVLIVTPLMNRAQQLKSSQEIIFIDSTGSVDTTSNTITVILTISKAGAIPIAILIHYGQTEESYKGALSLLKLSFPQCFGGKEAPTVFMTDDSKAEKNALNSLWPTARQFLCHFHMAQAEWRWLHDNKNEVRASDRLTLMRKFQKVMYSDNEQDLEKSVLEIRCKSESHSNFVRRFEGNFNRKDQWVRLYRRNILYRNNETNNYAEASIRIIKDILLNRTKAYNTVALVDFIVSVGEEYFTLRLLDHAHDRNTKTHRLYSKLCSKIVNITIEDVKQIDEHTYSIPSGSDKQTLYTINTEIGVCSCKDGCVGAFCKHQAWVHDKLKVQLSNAPAVTLEERYSLGVLALGEKCPELNFFLGLKENLPKNSIYEILTTSSITLKETGFSENSSANLNMEQTSSQLNSENKFDSLNNNDNDNKVVHTVLEEWSRLQNMIPSLPSSILQNLSSRLKNIHNSEQFIGFVHSVNKTAININRRKGKIRVQPTSISRRKEGVTCGKRITAGRKPNGMIMKRKVKRPNNLGKNISKNLLNSKSHGSGH